MSAHRWCTPPLLAVPFAAFAVWMVAAPLDVLLRDHASDDAFYYLQIARVLASEGQSSFDGIHPTNGYHPLWLLLLTLLHLVVPLDAEGFFRASKVLEVALVGAGLGCFARALRGAPLWLPALCLGVALCARVDELYEGLETGLWFATTGLAALAARRWGSMPSVGRGVALGLALGCAGLARLEAFAMAPLLVLATVVARRQRGDGRLWLRAAILPLVVAGAIAGAYIASNILWFGAAMPISGQVKAWWSSLRSPQLAFGEHLAELLGHRDVRDGLLLGAASVVGLAWVARRGATSAARTAWATLAALGLLHAARVGWFAWSTQPPFSHYTHYYLTGPWLRFGVPAAVILSLPADRWATRLRAVAVAVGVAVGLGIGIRGALRLTEARAEPVDWEMVSHAAAADLHALVGAGARVGTFDAGVFGYFSAAKVVNLDGLVNSQEYFAAAREGRAEQFAIDAGIGWIANAVPVEETDDRAWLCRHLRVDALRGTIERIRVAPLRTTEGEAVEYRFYRYRPPR